MMAYANHSFKCVQTALMLLLMRNTYFKLRNRNTLLMSSHSTVFPLPQLFKTLHLNSIFRWQIENLQEQLRDKDKQLGNLKDRVKSLQTDSSNTDTALATLEEALSEKVCSRRPPTKKRRTFLLRESAVHDRFLWFLV